MSRGISKLQRIILELVSIPGDPAGLPRQVIQAQLWPDIFEHDYRYTPDSPRIIKEKNKYRVTLSRAIASLRRRRLVEEKWNRIDREEVARRGLILPYQLKQPCFFCNSKPYYRHIGGWFIVNSCPPDKVKKCQS